MESLPPWMCFTLAGALGALANVALGSKAVMLPRVEGHRVRLGFLGQLVLCISVAHVIDHNFQTAFFGALCGAGFLRHVKQRIEQAFEEETRGVDDDGG